MRHGLFDWFCYLNVLIFFWQNLIKLSSVKIVLRIMRTKGGGLYFEVPSILNTTVQVKDCTFSEGISFAAPRSCQRCCDHLFSNDCDLSIEPVALLGKNDQTHVNVTPAISAGQNTNPTKTFLHFRIPTPTKTILLFLATNFPLGLSQHSQHFQVKISNIQNPNIRNSRSFQKKKFEHPNSQHPKYMFFLRRIRKDIL